MLVVSNGFAKFPMSVAAAEAERRGTLAALITGAWPTPRLVSLLRATGLDRRPRLQRLLARGELIAAERVHPLALAELVADLRRLADLRPLTGLRLARRYYHAMDRASFALYARRAARIRERLQPAPTLYHVRAGFGGPSIDVARRRGAVILVDHSIAHPDLLRPLVEGGGRMPPPGQPVPAETRSPWPQVMADLEAADHIVANSDFVRDTFVNRGWPAADISVVWQGIDDQVLAAIAHTPARMPDNSLPEAGPLRLLFAGAVSARKGVPDLAAALLDTADGRALDWHLSLAGDVEADMRSVVERLVASGRVRVLGRQSRHDLIRHMKAAEVFVFPSLAEGSARVVSEALAAGLYAVVTPNAGSLVHDGAHGAVVAPGDPPALGRALNVAAADRARLRAIGRHNAAMMARDYTQQAYGAALDALYR
ncbi:MAG: glycosyltransferase family 4 protein, partial [Alphaproteobacteria bacterium]